MTVSVWSAPHQRPPLGRNVRMSTLAPGRTKSSSVPIRNAVDPGGGPRVTSTHIRVAERSASCALPEGMRGLFVVGGGSVRVPRLIGVARMVDLILTGRRYDAAEGYAVGLSQYLVDDGDGLAHHPRPCDAHRRLRPAGELRGASRRSRALPYRTEWYWRGTAGRPWHQAAVLEPDPARRRRGGLPGSPRHPGPPVRAVAGGGDLDGHAPVERLHRPGRLATQVLHVRARARRRRPAAPQGAVRQRRPAHHARAPAGRLRRAGDRRGAP